MRIQRRFGAWRRGERPARTVSVCDASCRLEARATVPRSEAAIVTTRVR